MSEKFRLLHSSDDVGGQGGSYQSADDQKVLEFKKKLERNMGERPTYIDDADSAPVPEPSAPESQPQPERNTKRPRGKKSRAKTVRIVLAAISFILVVAIVMGGLGYAGAVDVGGMLAYVGVGTSKNYTYPVDDYDTLIRYLKHPSLKSGDTLQLGADFTVDIGNEYGGFAYIPLLNIEGGSLTFKNGSILFLGSSGTVDMSKVKFNDIGLYIEAPSANLKLSGADDTNINVATLNGASHRRDINLPFPGAKMSVPVKFTNTGDTTLNNVAVKLASPSFVFINGDEYIIDSIPGGGSVTRDINVIATEAGRLKIIAYSVGAPVFGQSEPVHVMGPGFYAGDVHTHTAGSGPEYFGDLESNVKSGYNNGMSFIVSVELGKKEPQEAERLPQSVVDSLTKPGEFLQITGGETGNDTRNMLIFNSEERPSTRYGELYIVDPETGESLMWTYQGAVSQVVDDGGTVVLPHFFDHDVSESVSIALSVKQAAGIEVVTRQHTFSDVETQAALDVWNSKNIKGERFYAVMASNNVDAEDVGSMFIKGYMPILTEQNFYAMLRDGSFFCSNGPEVRFRMAGADMGGEFEAAAGSVATAGCYASDTSPLTSVRLLKYEVSGKTEDLDPVIVYQEDLTGRGVYSFYKDIEVEFEETEKGVFYRFEAFSEKAAHRDDIGMAFSNPIWCVTAERSGFANIESIENVLGAEVKQAPGGALYVKTSGVVPAFVDVKSTGLKTSVEYHRFNSNIFADYVIIDIIAENGSHTVQKIYVIN